MHGSFHKLNVLLKNNKYNLRWKCDILLKNVKLIYLFLNAVIIKYIHNVSAVHEKMVCQYFKFRKYDYSTLLRRWIITTYCNFKKNMN